MMKYIKFILVLFLLSSLFVCAEDNSIIDLSKKGEITLYKYASENGRYVDGTLNDVDMSSISNQPLENVQFSYLKVGDLVKVADDKNYGLFYQLNEDFITFLDSVDLQININVINDIKYSTIEDINILLKAINTSSDNLSTIMSDYVIENGNLFPVTNYKGCTRVSDLDLGLYIIAEHSNSNKYNGLQIARRIKPFMVSLPSTNITEINGNEPNSIWQYSVVIYPKNELMGIDKDIIDDNNELIGSDDYFVGDTIQFLLTIDLPALQKHNDDSFSKFIINDIFSDGISVNDFTNSNFKVTVGLERGNINNKELIDLEDFIIEGKSNGFSIIFTDHGLAYLDTLTADAKIFVKYNGILNSNAANNTGGLKEEVNATSMIVGTNNSPDYEFDGIKDVKLYNYEINIEKQFSKEVDDLSDVSFNLLLDDKKLSFIKEADGIYTFVQNIHNNDIVHDQLYLNDKGKLIIKGLDSTTYKLKELSTVKGFNLMKDDLFITLEKNTTVDGTLKDGYIKIDDETPLHCTELLDDGIVSFKLINNAYIENIHTGGKGWGITFVIIGLIVVGSGLIMIKGTIKDDKKKIKD